MYVCVCVCARPSFNKTLTPTKPSEPRVNDLGRVCRRPCLWKHKRRDPAETDFGFYFASLQLATACFCQGGARVLRGGFCFGCLFVCLFVCLCVCVCVCVCVFVCVFVCEGNF